MKPSARLLQGNPRPSIPPRAGGLPLAKYSTGVCRTSLRACLRTQRFRKAASAHRVRRGFDSDCGGQGIWGELECARDGRNRLIFRVGRNTAAWRHSGRPERLPDTSKAPRRRSAGIWRESDEPVGQALGELMKSLAFSAGVAADLALVEDQ